MEKATRQFTKVHNIRLVLKTIYEQAAISRADVARVTGLTRATVSEIVGGLIEDGLIEEVGVGESAGGKPPILVSLRDNSRQLICVDLSGREFRGALVDLRGKIRCQRTVSTEDQTGEALVPRLVGLIESLRREAEAPLVGIGVSIPGLTDPVEGIVRRSIRLDWTDLPLRAVLAGRFHLPIHLMNDSHAAALAEFTFGEHSQTPNLIVVRVDEGIGCGIILSGHLHYGDGNGAGEIGHLTVVDGGRQCLCGNYGCLETVASPRAILQRLQELAEYEWISFSAGPAPRPEEITWDFVREAFLAGDETVTELVKEAGRYLGVSIANLVSILNVHHIIITGSFTGFGQSFLDAVSSEVARRALTTMTTQTYIANSILGPDNIILGASALVLSSEVGLP
jgi:predicted NBD/HSP70 family sugar kinase